MAYVLEANASHVARSQVEFYFSDANLPTDKKLLKQIRKDPDGFGKPSGEGEVAFGAGVGVVRFSHSGQFDGPPLISPLLPSLPRQCLSSCSPTSARCGPCPKTWLLLPRRCATPSCCSCRRTASA